MKHAILVSKVDVDLELDINEDDPFIEELMAVFVDDEENGFTAQQKADDYVKYVSENSDTYDVDGEVFPQYEMKIVRCY